MTHDINPAGGRRHDVDWIRVIALGLLVFYHLVITFQPWARYIFFMQNGTTLEGLWPVMEMLNVWRIPVLFLVSGMGVQFAMERRNRSELLAERSTRILLPLVFGSFAITPISVVLVSRFYGVQAGYVPNLGHLWFLANLMIYVVALLPLFEWSRTHPDGPIVRGFRLMVRKPWAIYLLAVPVVLEAWLLSPESFSTYAYGFRDVTNAPHSQVLGGICFLIGFLFASAREASFGSAARVRWVSLGLALALYGLRISEVLGEAERVVVGFESMSWMLAVVGFAARYLNKPSRALAYLSRAVYPVYILHLPVQHALSLIVIPLALPAILKLLLLTALTLGVSTGIYEGIRRVWFIRPLFGLRLDPGRAG